MPTRTGTSYQPESYMDTPQEALLKTMSEQLAQLTAQLDNRMNRFEARLDSLERTPRPTFEQEPETPLSPLAPPRRVH